MVRIMMSTPQRATVEQTELGDNVVKALRKDKTKVLALSGTPFNILDQYEEDSVYTWDYVMEQRRKAEWDTLRPGDHNPYADLSTCGCHGIQKIGGWVACFLEIGSIQHKRKGKRYEKTAGEGAQMGSGATGALRFRQPFPQMVITLCIIAKENGVFYAKLSILDKKQK